MGGYILEFWVIEQGLPSAPEWKAKSYVLLLKANSLVDSVIDQQLCEDRREEGGGDPQAKTTPGPIKHPPQAQGQGCERQWELHVVVKV